MTVQKTSWPRGSGVRMTLLLTVALTAGACEHHYSPTEPYHRGGEGLVGSGHVVEENRSVVGVDRVVLSGVGLLRIEQGAGESLVVRAEDNLLSRIRTEVYGGTLDIWVDGPLQPTRPIEYVLTVRDLREVQVTGAGSVEGRGLAVDELWLRTTGAGNMVFDALVADRLRAEIAGAGNMWLSGRVEEQQITITGAGNYDARDLTCHRAEVEILGTGSVTVRVRDELVVRIAGVGNVYYLGDPTVTSIITGAGEVFRIGG